MEISILLLSQIMFRQFLLQAKEVIFLFQARNILVRGHRIHLRVDHQAFQLTITLIFQGFNYKIESDEHEQSLCSLL